MFRTILALAAALAAWPSAAQHSMPARVLEALPEAQPAWFAPGLPVVDAVRLPALLEKAVAVDEGGRVRLGPVRAVEKMSQPLAWRAAPGGGDVARVRVASEGAAGLRVRLALGAVPGAFELRAQGSTGGIESQVVDPVLGPEAWGPWTDGDAQVVELASRVRPSPGAVTVTGVLHTALSPTAKAAGTCTIPTMCPTGNLALDDAIATTKRAVTRLSFVENGQGFYCTGTLINTELFPAAFLLTANHCISTRAAAASLTTQWFYENPTCSTTNPPFGSVQAGAGATVAFTNYSVDSTLLLMDFPPPAGAVYASWNAQKLAVGTPVVSISHPRGDTSRLAQGSVSGGHRFSGYPQDMYLVQFGSGIIEPGSSGSGLFVMNGGTLELRSLAFGTTANSGGLSCTNTNEQGIFGHFDVFAPQIAPFITKAGKSSDDAPNRIVDYPQGIDTPLETMANGLAFARAVEYGGDVDLFRFSLASTAVVGAWTQGPNIDTVGQVLDADGTAIEADDDAEASNNHFGITRTLSPGTYYLQVEHWEPAATGPYTARLQAWTVGSDNYTNLWWNPAEPGWGINVNHQGNTLFATLFTYDRDGTPMWLVMSDGAKQSDGSFTGPIYRARGPAFNASPWGAVTLTQVGSMTLAFSGPKNGAITYTVDGTRVFKAITVQAFDSPVPTCSWSAFDRSYTFNLQDLWWNANESGWGLNLAQQGDTIFATLFTYDATGKGAWYVMSNGSLTANQQGWSGTLYRTSARSFDAAPWVPATVTAVGTLQANVRDGNSMSVTITIDGVSVTRQVQRQVFASPKPDCDS